MFVLTFTYVLNLFYLFIVVFKYCFKGIKDDALVHIISINKITTIPLIWYLMLIPRKLYK